MLTGSTRHTLTLAALLLAAPTALQAQKATKEGAMDRTIAALQVTNGLRASTIPDGARPISVGARQSSSLGPGDPTLDDGSYVELWVVELRAGQTVTVTMRSTEFDALLMMGALDDPDNTAENDDIAEGVTDARITFRARSNGMYGILANTFTGGESGSYTLEIQTAGGGDMADLMGGGGGSSSISYGAAVSGSLADSDRTLDDGSKYDEYTFQGSAGDRIVITLESSDFDAYLILEDANGESIASNDDFEDSSLNSRITIVLPSTGRFTILANSLGEGQLGAYRLTLRKR